MITFTNACYIKLGRGGVWEQDSIVNGRMRFGWPDQSVEDINAGAWDRIEAQLRSVPGVTQGRATNDVNRLRDIVSSTSADIWVTFHQAKLWWTRLAAGPVEGDGLSKFRRTSSPWSDRSRDGRLLVVSEIPGKLAQLQGFRGTVCSVKEVDLLRRVLNDEESPVVQRIRRHRHALAAEIRDAITMLHWRDFETLVDLVFRASGWARVSVVGQQVKDYDLELREPVSGERAVVQVKSRAGQRELEQTVAAFSPDDYRHVFFVVHSPSGDLRDESGFVDIVGPDRLAELAIQAGLVRWIEDKVA